MMKYSVMIKKVNHHNTLVYLHAKKPLNKRILNSIFTKKKADYFIKNQLSKLTNDDYIKMISSLIFYRLKNGE